MTDYNDGEWHGWNGGDCPVHKKSKVECVYTDNQRSITRQAIAFVWSATSLYRPVAFRVIKEHREPREWWLTGGCGFDVWSTEEDAIAADHGPLIHVREVIE